MVRGGALNESTSGRVTDHQERGGPVAFGRIEDIGGVEVFGVILHDHRAAGDPTRQSVPVRRAVHEWRSWERPDGAAGVGHDLIERPVLGAVAAPNAQRGHQEICLAPHGALGQTGRAARVTDVQVVPGPRSDQLARKFVGRVGQRHFVVDRSVEEGMPGPIGDLEDQCRFAFKGGEYCPERRSEALVDDDRSSPSIVEEVAQLVGNVPVVHVEGRTARLPRPEHPLEILVAVVEVERNMVVD